MKRENVVTLFLDSN